jgi:uncharacterized phage-associated protein
MRTTHVIDRTSVRTIRQIPVTGDNRSCHWDYGDPMTTSAQQVAAALRRELPGLPTEKVHKLLYYVQGHHLALFGQPAFTEAIAASEDGPEIDFDCDRTLQHTPGALSQSVLNVVGLVAARYGRLTFGDLSRLSRAESPWQDSGRGDEIGHHVLCEYFTTDGAQEPVPAEFRNDPERRRRIAEEVNRTRTDATGKPDDLDELLAEVTGRAGE